MSALASNDEKIAEAGPSTELQSAIATGAATIEESHGHKAKRSEKLAKGNEGVDQSKILHDKQLYLAFSSMLLTLLLVAVDQTILSPALPVISSAFNSFDQSSWIVSSFIFTQACFLLVVGQLLQLFDRKLIYLVAIVVFEVGSLLCGVAPNVNVLIFGRAVAGIGASGIFVSLIALIADIVALENRPVAMGLFGGIFGISSVVGPLLGGAFTQHVSWRWCFYINLPIGAIAFAAVLFILPRTPARPLPAPILETAQKRASLVSRGKWHPVEGTISHKLICLDWVGTVLLLGWIIPLLLAVQWGGAEKPWGSAAVIACFVVTGVVFVAFLAFEAYGAGAAPVLPLRYFKSRTIIGCSIIGACQFWAMFILTYYLPTRFEAVNNKSPTQAGIMILPFMGTFIVLSIVCATLIKKTGRYWYFLATFPAFLSVGAGLLYTLGPDASYAKVAGFQVIFGMGIGPVFQQVFLAVQANVLPVDIAQASATVSLSQRLGGALGIAIAGSVLNGKLRSNLDKYAPTANRVVLENVAAVWDNAITSEAIRPAVIRAYSESLKWTFVIAIPLGGVCLLAAWLVNNVSIKAKPGQAAPASAAESKTPSIASGDDKKPVEKEVPLETA